MSRQRNSKVFWDKIPLYCAVPALSSRRGHRWHLGVASCPLGGPGSHWATPGDPQESPRGECGWGGGKSGVGRGWNCPFIPGIVPLSQEGLELSVYPRNCPIIPRIPFLPGMPGLGVGPAGQRWSRCGPSLGGSRDPSFPSGKEAGIPWSVLGVGLEGKSRHGVGPGLRPGFEPS